MAEEERKPGPKPDRLKIDGDWEDAVKKAMGKERPEGGWPEDDPSPEEPQNDNESQEQDSVSRVLSWYRTTRRGKARQARPFFWRPFASSAYFR